MRRTSKNPNTKISLPILLRVSYMLFFLSRIKEVKFVSCFVCIRQIKVMSQHSFRNILEQSSKMVLEKLNLFREQRELGLEKK